MEINYKNLRGIGLYKNENVEDFRLNKIETIMIFALIVWDSHICIWCVMVKSIPYPLLFNFIPISPTTHNFICYFFLIFCYLLVKVERTSAINFQWVLAVGNFWGRSRIEILCRTEGKTSVMFDPTVKEQYWQIIDFLPEAYHIWYILKNDGNMQV